MRFAWALLLSACAPSGTGVLLDVQGNIALDTLQVTATVDGAARARSTRVTTLPTTYLAILPDEDASLALTIEAQLDGHTVASAITPTLSITSHHVSSYTVELGGADASTGFQRVQGGSGAPLTGIWGSSPTDIYVTSTTLLHSSGTSFTSATVGGPMSAVWGADASHVFLVGDNGTLLHGSGTSFTADTTPAGSHGLRGVWGSSATDVYVVGEGNTILHSVTGGWVQQTAVGTTTLQGVWGADASHVWAVGTGGTILFSTGNDVWTAQASGTSANLSAIHGRSASEVYAVGDGGTIVKWDGSAWTSVASPTTASLATVRCGDKVYAAGDDGTLLASFIVQGLPFPGRIRGAWIDPESTLWLVGDAGTIFKQ